MDDKRIYWLDNAKFLLVTIVLVMHFIQGSSFSPNLKYDNHFSKTVDIIAFFFVMQGFIFISGLLSKAQLTDEYIQKLLMQLIVPYIMADTIAYLVAPNFVTGYLLDPAPVLWYLPALFIWRIALPIVNQLRWPIFISIICALAVGYEERISYFLTLSRVFTFFPFFLLGYYYGKKVLNVLHFKYKKIFGIFIFALAFIITWNYFPIDPLWLLMGDPYSTFGVQHLQGPFIRLTQFMIAATLSFAFFLLVPTTKTFFSELGTRSIYPYLIHPLIILSMLKLGVYDAPSTFTQFLLIPFAIVCSFILSSSWIKILFDPILFPSFAKKLFRKLNDK